MTPEQYRVRMVDAMQEAGSLAPEWREAFLSVPREILVPRYLFWQDEWLSQTDGDRYYEFLYDREVTVTIAPEEEGLTTATMPAIVAEQFADLDPCPGHRILEIGTGSGYSTALLCEYGAEVTSVDVLPQVISAARDRLASLDYHPKLVASDGHAGYQNNAPYDRVLGEVQVSRIPQPWVDQTRVGGKIGAVLPRGWVVLTRAADGSATGAFGNRAYSFIRLVGHTAAKHDWDDFQGPEGPTRVMSTALDLSDFWWNPTERSGGYAPGRSTSWRLFRLLRLPHSTSIPDGRWNGNMAVMDDVSGSWFLINQNLREVTEGGRRSLWTEYEAWCRHLDRLGNPAIDRFGLTVRPDGTQYVWLAGTDEHWELEEPG